MSRKFSNPDRNAYRDARQTINAKLRQKDARNLILSNRRRKLTDARGIISGRRKQIITDARSVINHRSQVTLSPDDHIMILPRRTIKNNLYTGASGNEMRRPTVVPARRADVPISRNAGRKISQWRFPRATPNVDFRITKPVSPVPTDRPSQEPPTYEPSPLQGFKLEVRNLHPSVTNDDLYELFSSIGRLRQSRLLKPGFGEVVYHKREDAVNAISQYNTRELDGQPMEVRLVTSGSALTNAIQKRNPGSQMNTKDMEVEYDTVTKALFNVSQQPNVRRPVNFFVNM